MHTKLTSTYSPRLSGLELEALYGKNVIWRLPKQIFMCQNEKQKTTDQWNIKRYNREIRPNIELIRSKVLNTNIYLGRSNTYTSETLDDSLSIAIKTSVIFQTAFLITIFKNFFKNATDLINFSKFYLLNAILYIHVD